MMEGNKADYIDVGKYSIKIDDFLAYRFCCGDQETIKCTKDNKCCCRVFFVDTTAKKVNRILDILDLISEFCPHLKDGDEYLNPFEENEDKRYSLDTKENDYCAFSYFDKNAALRCGIHSAALKINADPFFYKPLTCGIWPVAIFKEENGREVVSLGVGPKGVCLKKKSKIDNRIDLGLMRILKLLLGKDMQKLIDVLSDKHYTNTE